MRAVSNVDAWAGGGHTNLCFKRGRLFSADGENSMVDGLTSAKLVLLLARRLQMRPSAGVLSRAHLGFLEQTKSIPKIFANVTNEMDLASVLTLNF